MDVVGMVEAARAGAYPELRYALEQDPTLAQRTSKHRKTPLHWAAEENLVPLAKALLDAGADIEARTDWGHTAFEWAASMNSGDVAELLLAAGSSGLNLWTAAALGKLAVVQSYWFEGTPTVADSRPIVDGAEATWPLDCAYLTGDFVSDAFYGACRNGRLEVARFLLGQGAEIDARGYFGATSLHWAAHNGHDEVVRFLMDEGADLKLRDDKFKATAMSWAVESDYHDIAFELRERMKGES